MQITVDASESAQSITVSNNYVTGTVLFQYIDVTLYNQKYRVDLKLDVYRYNGGDLWTSDHVDLECIRDVFMVKESTWDDVEREAVEYNAILAASVLAAVNHLPELFEALEEERSALIVKEKESVQSRLDALDKLLPEEPGDDED